MEIGSCPRCSRPYTSSEVAGVGILRPRRAAAGGPLVEFLCPGCHKKLRLIPHGEGRYAPPGKPPPRHVPPEERRPPWVTGEPADANRVHEVPEPELPPRDPASSPSDETDAAEGDERMSIAEALEVLGIGATADEAAIDQAFRERSLTCHPDKVAHLDDEFQALAEQKFKRLRAAYDRLR